MKNVGPTRVELGTRTIFNLLGPLSNPAGVQAADGRRVLAAMDRAAGAGARRTSAPKRAWVVHGSDGLDEITTSGPTHVAALENGTVRTFEITPEDVGLAARQAGGAARRRRARRTPQALRDVLKGKKGPFRDVALLNAAAGLIVAGTAKDLQGRRRARRQIDRLRRGRRPPRPPDRGLERLRRDGRHPRPRSRPTSARRSPPPSARARSPRSRRTRQGRAAAARLSAPRSSASSRRGDYALIAEIKKASPSKGLIRADFDPPALARAYEAGGATCLSVLTDAPSFQGKPEYLDRGARRDRAAGAAQGFHVRALSGGRGARLGRRLHPDHHGGGRRRDRARSRGRRASRSAWTCCSRCTTRRELERALTLRSRLIGINNRDLKTFETTLATSERLAPLVPRDRIVVGESGIFTPADLARARRGRHATPSWSARA